jgi:hypothetical protein
MTAKTIADREKKSKGQKDELESGELDKVTGGMKPTGGSALKTNRTVLGDPCEGGE